jgi:hypothetical protein
MPDEVMAENIEVESPTPEESPTTEKESPVESEAVETVDEDAEPGKVAKKSAQGRIQQLNSELKEERKRRSALEEKVNSIVQENEENPFSPVNMPLMDPKSGRLAQPNENGEITYEDYQRDVQQNAKATVKAVLDQQRLKQEALEAIKEFPELDPNSDQFDEDLSDAITEAVESKHRFSSNFSVKSTVSKLMKPYRKAAESAVDSERRNVVKDIASGAIRPSSNPTPVSREPAEETIEQMEARLGKVY